jgi:hypothetical protein
MDRQTWEEGFTPEHDDAHPAGELARAGAVYAVSNYLPGVLAYRGSDVWPWMPEDLKPKQTRRSLIVAAALIAREIARFDRGPLP